MFRSFKHKKRKVSNIKYNQQNLIIHLANILILGSAQACKNTVHEVFGVKQSVITQKYFL